MTPEALNNYLNYYDKEKGIFRKLKSANFIIALKLLWFRHNNGEEIPTDKLKEIINKYTPEKFEDIEFEHFFRDDILLYTPKASAAVRDISLSESILITLNKIIQGEAPPLTVVAESSAGYLIDLNNQTTTRFEATKSRDGVKTDKELSGTAAVICSRVTQCVVSILYDKINNKLAVTHVLAAPLVQGNDTDIAVSGIESAFNIDEQSFHNTKIDVYLLNVGYNPHGNTFNMIKQIAEQCGSTVDLKQVNLIGVKDSGAEFTVTPTLNNQLIFEMKVENKNEIHSMVIELSPEPQPTQQLNK